MQIPEEILYSVAGGIGAIFTGIAAYIKKRLVILDELRDELSDTKARLAVAETTLRLMRSHGKKERIEDI